ncbi:MAG: M23 family metallopeptidase, partial [Oscillospiraceae bacterium]|nr:M23 family metallopeptidase [Oscillospiraceae bacterium]
MPKKSNILIFSRVLRKIHVYNKSDGTRNDGEYFSQNAGLVEGTWIASNDGHIKEANIEAFYTKVFGCLPDGRSRYLQNLYGAYSIVYASTYGYHSGIDMNVSNNANYNGDRSVYAAYSGIVVQNGGKYGTVAIYNDTDNMTYVYAHLGSI